MKVEHYPMDRVGYISAFLFFCLLQPQIGHKETAAKQHFYLLNVLNII